MQPTLHVPTVTITDTLDTLHHPLRDLRISVTDRCNFRCVYFMPKAIFGCDFQFLPPAMLLSFEEITRFARLFIASGVGKIWLMGGESLVRREVEWPVAMLAQLDGLRVQSIAEEEVGRRSADPALAPPTRQIQEIGGPQVLSLGKMARAWLTLRQMRHAILPLWIPGKVAAGYHRGDNTCGLEHLHGEITWAQWVQRTYQGVPPTLSSA